MYASHFKPTIITAIAVIALATGAADANHKNILKNTDRALSKKVTNPTLQGPMTAAPLKIACSIYGTPVAAPNDLLIWEHYGRLVPAGTKIKWILPVHGKSGILTLPHIAAGDKYAKTNAVPGGASGGVPCAAVVL